jgi:hypothetical protein
LPGSRAAGKDLELQNLRTVEYSDPGATQSSQSVDMDIQEWTGFLFGFAENYMAAPYANWQSFDLGVLAMENHTVNCMAVVFSGSVLLPESE